MKFLITGGSGFVGRRLSERLIKEHGDNNEFVFIIRNRKLDFLDKYREKVKITIVKGDISDISSIEKHFEDIDYVFHIAAKLEYGDFKSSDYYRINVDGTRNIFDLSKKYKIKKIIYISTAGIFCPTYDKKVDENTKLEEKHTTRYTHSKYLSYVKSLEYIKLGVPIINILPVSVFGENAPLFKPLIKQTKKWKLIFIPKINSRLSLIYIDDLVNGIIQVFKTGDIGESYIFSGKSLSIKDIIKKIAYILDRKITIIELPASIVKITFKVLDVISKVTKIRFYYNTEFFNFIKGGLIASNKKVIEKFNYQETDFDCNFIKMVKSFHD